MTMDEYIEDMMGELVEDSFDEMSYESETWYYRVDAKKGRIYVAESEDELEDTEEYIEYSIKGDKLIVKKLVDEAGAKLDIKLNKAADVIYNSGADLPWSVESEAQSVLDSIIE